MNQTFGPEWEAGFKPEHHALTTLTGGSEDQRYAQTFIKLPLEGRTLLLHPYEGAVPPRYIDYRALHLKFREGTKSYRPASARLTFRPKHSSRK